MSKKDRSNNGHEEESIGMTIGGLPLETASAEPLHAADVAAATPVTASGRKVDRTLDGSEAARLMLTTLKRVPRENRKKVLESLAVLSELE